MDRRTRRSISLSRSGRDKGESGGNEDDEEGCRVTILHHLGSEFRDWKKYTRVSQDCETVPDSTPSGGSPGPRYRGAPVRLEEGRQSWGKE